MYKPWWWGSMGEHTTWGRRIYFAEIREKSKIYPTSVIKWHISGKVFFSNFRKHCSTWSSGSYKTTQYLKGGWQWESLYAHGKLFAIPSSGLLQGYVLVVMLCCNEYEPRLNVLLSWHTPYIPSYMYSCVLIPLVISRVQRLFFFH